MNTYILIQTGKIEKKKQKKILLLVFILTKILGIKTNLKTAY